MQRQDYCVYNQTNECFLSLGATLGDRPFTRLKQWIGLGRRRADEGTWFRPYERHRALTLFMTRDLVYLDTRQRVVHLVESFPALRSVPQRPDAATLLALPVHAISSSQTGLGNQLLICAPAEMERKLRKLFEPSFQSQKQQSSQPVRVAVEPREQPRVHATIDFAQFATASDRRPIDLLGPDRTASERGNPDRAHSDRNTDRSLAERANTDRTLPPPISLDAGILSLPAVRNLTGTGLYLVTRERWPIGAEINMSLQPGGGIRDDSAPPVMVRMRVTRWGSDGVGLEFAGTAAELTELKSPYVC
ncbi:MAG TPA: hypothetical protein VGL22_04450 [Terracidiphilus sp.]